MRTTLPLLILLSACARDPGPATAEADAGLAAVEAVPLGRGVIRDGIESTATVEARARALVRAQVAGVLVALPVEEGARVKAQETIAQIERPSFSEVLARARSERDRAARETRALEKMASEGLVPNQQLIDARFALRQASLEVERLDKERALETVQSPIDGVVTARHVQPGESVAVGAPLFDVADVGALELSLRLPERHLPRLAAGQRVEIFPEGLEEAAAVLGSVERIAPTVDARSGTVKVTVAIPDPGAVPLRPGMYVRARIIVDVRDAALLLPKRALIFEEDRAFAFRVVAGKAQKVRLELGYQDRDRVQVLTPLVEGDQVVIFGQRGLADGTPVQVVGAPKPDGGPP